MPSLNSDHSGLNKFESHEHCNFQLVLKGLRAIASKVQESRRAFNKEQSSLNKYYEVPHSVSAVFTGRTEILQNMDETMFASPQSR